MMETQQEKLEREKIEAAKVEAQATMLKAVKESSNVALAKIKEESKILMADISTMDPLEIAWYLMYRDHVGKEVWLPKRRRRLLRWRQCQHHR
jgi:hypothetical protein